VVARPEIEFGPRDTFADKEERLPGLPSVIPIIDSARSVRQHFLDFLHNTDKLNSPCSSGGVIMRRLDGGAT
jgi:hypothetical protein